MAGVSATLATAIQTSNSQSLSRPGSPVVSVDITVRTPLKLHNVVHPFTRPPLAGDLAHAQSQLAFLEDHLGGLCGLRERPQRQFIAHYFAAIRHHVRAHSQELNDKTGPLAGLSELHHWCFSALMPMPRAYLRLPAESEDPEISLQDFVRVDFAFWDGQDVIVAIIDTGNTLTPSQRRARTRLEQSGIQMRTMSAKNLPQIESDQLLNNLGPGFTRFWHDDPFPLSPFGGSSIADPIPAGGGRR